LKGDTLVMILAFHVKFSVFISPWYSEKMKQYLPSCTKQLWKTVKTYLVL